MHLFEFIHAVGQASLLYSATSLRPNLRDRIASTHLLPGTSRTMMLTTSAMCVRNLTTDKYPVAVEACSHDRGTRTYGAGGKSIMICDQCGQRWVKENNEYKLAAPKASPKTSTPLTTSSSKPRASSSATSRRTTPAASPPTPDPQPSTVRAGLVASAPRSAPSSSQSRRPLASRRTSQPSTPLVRQINTPSASDSDASSAWTTTEVPYLQEQPPEWGGSQASRMETDNQEEDL